MLNPDILPLIFFFKENQSLSRNRGLPANPLPNVSLLSPSPEITKIVMLVLIIFIHALCYYSAFVYPQTIYDIVLQTFKLFK